MTLKMKTKNWKGSLNNKKIYLPLFKKLSPTCLKEKNKPSNQTRKRPKQLMGKSRLTNNFKIR